MAKYDRIIIDFIDSGQTANRRKVEELLSSLNKSKRFKAGVDELYLELMKNGTNVYIDSVEDKDHEYSYKNSFYDIDSKDSLYLKVEFERIVNDKHGNKMGSYRSGFATYVIKKRDDGFVFMPIMRVDLEDAEEKGVVVPHTTNVNPYEGSVADVYSTYFTNNEPAPHIHFYNDSIGELYRDRNEFGKEKGINGNAISLEHLLKYIKDVKRTLEGYEMQYVPRENEMILAANDFGMPYLKLLQDKDFNKNYTTHPQLLKDALRVSFDVSFEDEFEKFLGKSNDELKGADALIFDLKYASLLSHLMDGKLKNSKGSIKNALTDIMTKISMQYNENEIELGKRDRMGIYGEWGDNTNDELADYFDSVIKNKASVRGK